LTATCEQFLAKSLAKMIARAVVKRNQRCNLEPAHACDFPPPLTHKDYPCDKTQRTDRKSVSVCISGERKSRACASFKLHFWIEHLFAYAYCSAGEIQ